MDLAELLKGAGLDEDQVNAVTTAMKENKVYVSSEENIDIRYGKLKTDHDSLKTQHTEAQTLIDQLQTSNSGNEELQSKISEYETKISELEANAEKLESETALKVALLEAKVEDVDYLTFKILEKGEIKLDDHGKIVGIEDTLAEMKTKFPNQFAAKSGEMQIDEKKLEQGEERGVTSDQFKKMGYQERNQLQREQPEVYEKLSKGE